MLFLLALIIGAVLFHELYWKRRRLPPGPLPLPLLGNILSMFRASNSLSVLHKWKEQYGNVYSYWLGTTPIVAVNDWASIKETFIKDGDTYADRAVFGKFSEMWRGGSFGIVETSGHVWQEQRRFALTTLRNFGLGKAAMQQRVLAEAEYMLRVLEEDGKAGPIKITSYLDRTVGSVINLVIFGYRFDDENYAEFYRLRQMFGEQEKATKNPAVMMMVFCMPLRHLPYFKDKYNLMWKIRDELFGFINKQIAAHRKEIDYESESSSDFCEAYLKEMHAHEDEADSTFFEQQLVNVCIDLWMAGMETTSATLAWTVLYMIRHPEIQAKAHAELDGVIGSSRLIDMDDRIRLPYVNAIINETQRCANIVIQNLLRRTSRDVIIEGHAIPAGTTIAPQISMLLYDPELFPNPEQFDPSRFLYSDGSLRKFEQFMPFSVGKRACPGEGLARMELYLFLANLLNRFEILPEDPANLPNAAQKLLSSGKPEPFNCVLRPRIVAASSE